MAKRIYHRTDVAHRSPEDQIVPLGNGFEPLEARLVLTSLLQASELLSDGGFFDQQNTAEVRALRNEAEPVSGGNTYRDAINIGSIRGSQTFHDYVGKGDRKDIYRFSLETDADVRIKLHNLEADAELRLLDGNRELINWSLRSGTNDEFIKVDLPKGDYFVRVDAFDGRNSTDYDLRITVIDNREDEGGDSVATATDLGEIDENSDIRISGWVGNGDRWDYYKFVANEFVNLRAVLSRLSANANLYLYDLDSNLIESSTNPGKDADRITRDISPGVYVFGVRAASGNSSYQLTASADPKEVDGRLANVDYFGSTARDRDLNAMYAPEAWSEGITGKDVVVAVIDSGVDHQHRDLSGQVWSNPGEIAGDGIDNDRNGFIDDTRGWDFNENDNNPNDENGHGTHVAGIIASARNKFGATGVAYNAKIMSIRVLDEAGDGGFGDLAKGIYYAVDNGADVINLSIGGDYNYSVRAAISYANAKGVFVSVASGNGGDDLPLYPARHSAALSNTMSVGAHTRSDAHAWFSNYVGTSRAIQVDAPGVNVFSTLPGNRYGRYSGTSSAAPFVSGLAALVLSVNKSFSPNLVRHFITEGAIRDIAGSDSIGGIDAARTLYLARQYGGDMHGSEFGAADDGSNDSGGRTAYQVQKQSLDSLANFAVSIDNRFLNEFAKSSEFRLSPTVDSTFGSATLLDSQLLTASADNIDHQITEKEIGDSDTDRESQSPENQAVDRVLAIGLELLS